MTKWTAPDIASIRGDNSRPLQKIFGSLTEYLKDYQIGYTLDSLDDVTITTPSVGQVLSYDATNSLWINTTGSVITNLNASNLASGTVPTGRVAGSYVGITGVGTLTTGSIPATLLTGTVASARISGSYTGITSLGTLTSLTIDAPLSPSVFFGDWNQNNNWSGIRGTHGYLLTGSSGGGDTGIFLRSESATHPVYIGSNNTNTLRVDSTSATFTGNVHVPNTSANYFGSANGSNFWQPMDTANNMYFKVGTGSFFVDSPNYFFRNSSSAVIMSLASSGATTINGALNAYSISGNSNVAGTGNASYHPSGVYSTGTNYLYGTVFTNGNSIGSTTQYVGAVYGSNWFRSSGTTGWYSESYGGGIYMEDATYVRVYNGKRFFSPGGYAGNVQYGSYGSIALYGSAGSWEGITFPDASMAWMSTANGQYFGVYRNNTTWNFYVFNGTFTPSDERYKRDIEPLQHGMNLIREIVPVTYDPLTEDPSDDPEQTVGRTHYGFTTQNILQALTNAGETRDIAIVDIGGPANESNESDRQYLNHSALIAPMIKAIQELDQRLQQLETV